MTDTIIPNTDTDTRQKQTAVTIPVASVPNKGLVAVGGQRTKAVPTTKGMSACITLAHIIKGENTDSGTLTAEITAIAAEVERRGLDINDDEFKVAVENGAWGRYGEYFKVSPIVVLQWLERFALIRNKARSKAQYAEYIERKSQDKADEMKRSAEEYAKFIKDTTNAAFIQYRDTKTLPEWSDITLMLVFRHIKSKGFIPKEVAESVTDINPVPTLADNKKVGYVDPDSTAWQSKFRKAELDRLNRQRTAYAVRMRKIITDVFDALINRK